MEMFATALPALGEAWALILQPVVMGYLVLGVVMGLAVGVFPGLGGIAGLSLLLPFMFGMEPVYGLALMIGPRGDRQTSWVQNRGGHARTFRRPVQIDP